MDISDCRRLSDDEIDKILENKTINSLKEDEYLMDDSAIMFWDDEYEPLRSRSYSGDINERGDPVAGLQNDHDYLVKNDNIQGAPKTHEEDSVGEAIALSDALIKRLLSLSNEKKSTLVPNLISNITTQVFKSLL